MLAVGRLLVAAGFTVIVKVCATDVSTPPLAVPALSRSNTVTVAVPLPVAAGVKFSVPLDAMVGCTENNALLLLLTKKFTLCVDSLGGPGECCWPSPPRIERPHWL